MSSHRARMLQPNHNWRQSEDVKIEANHGGAMTVRVEGRAHPYPMVGSLYLDADNAAGDRGRLGFVQGIGTLPVFMVRNTRPDAAFIGSDSGEEPVEVGLVEWAQAWGRPGGLWSIPKADGITLTELEPITTLEVFGTLRTTPEFMFVAFTQSSTLRLRRYPLDDIDNPEQWNTGISGSSGLYRGFTLYEFGETVRLLVTPTTGTLYCLEWNESPIWNYSLPNGWTFQTDPVPLTVEVDDGTVPCLACLALHGGTGAHWIVVLNAETGAAVGSLTSLPWATPGEDWPWVREGAALLGVADKDAQGLHGSLRGSTVSVRSNLFFWGGPPRFRDIMVAGDKIYPAIHYSDQLFCVEPDALDSRAWIIAGWADFDPEPEPSSVTFYERYTSIATTHDGLLAFVSRFGFEMAPAYREPVVEKGSKPAYWMRLEDIHQVELDSEGTRVVKATFEGAQDIVWEWHEGSDSDIWDDAGNFVAGDVADIADFEPGEEHEAELVLSQMHHAWRTYDLDDGSLIKELKMADIEEPLVDGTSGEPDWAQAEFLKGDPVGVVTKVTEYEREIDEQWNWAEQEDEWPDVPDGYEAVQKFITVRAKGRVRVCNNVLSAPHSGGPGIIDVRYPYQAGVTYDEYDFWGAYRHFRAKEELNEYAIVGFNVPEDVESGTDQPDLEWGIEWLEAEVTASIIYQEKHRVPLYADAAPRWSAVDCSVVDGKAVFGPGRRNEKPSSGSVD